MKKILLALVIGILTININAQTYTIDVTGSDTSIYYVIDNSRPFSIQVETQDVGATSDGQIYIYNKLRSAYHWNLIGNGSIPLTLNDSTGSYIFVNREPVCSEWLIIFDKNSADTGYVFITIADLARVNTGNSNFSTKGGISKNYPSNRLSSNRMIDITPVQNSRAESIYDSVVWTNDGTNATSILYYVGSQIQYKDTLIWDGSILRSIYPIK